MQSAMDVLGVQGASRRSLGKGSGALWLFVAVAMLLKPVAGETEVCQCDFADRSWERDVGDMINHIQTFEAHISNAYHPTTAFIRNYDCTEDVREADWKCRPQQSAVAAVCSLQAVYATTRRLVEPAKMDQMIPYHIRSTTLSYRQALFGMSGHWTVAVRSEMDQQRRVCAEQRVSAEKVRAQRQFEARRAEVQAQEEAKKAQAKAAAEGAQKRLENCQATAQEALSRSEASVKRAKQLLKESQARVEKAEARGTKATQESQLHETADWRPWRLLISFLLLLFCFWGVTVGCSKRRAREQGKALHQPNEDMVEELDAIKDRSKQAANAPSGAEQGATHRTEQTVTQLADQLAEALREFKELMREHLDVMKEGQLGLRKQEASAAGAVKEGATHLAEQLATRVADDASEVWSHTSWMEVSTSEALVANSSKISAGGTDSPEPCCYLQESLFLAEDKRTYIQGFDLYEGCKITAADGTAIRVRKVPELHRAEKTLILRAGGAVLQVTPDHRIALPTGDVVLAGKLEIGQEVLVQNTPTRLTSIELSPVPVSVLKLAFDPDLPVEVLVPPPAIQSKGLAKKALRRSLVGRRGSQEEPSIPDTEAAYQD